MNLNVSPDNVFVITTDVDFSKNLKSVFSQNFQLSIFSDWEVCLEHIDQNPSAIFFEIIEDSNWGSSFLDRINNFDKNIPVIIVQENNDITSLDFSSRSNVFHCIKKEELTQKCVSFLMKSIQRINHLQINLDFALAKNNSNLLENIVSNCAPMQKVIQLSEKAAKTNITCYISGEKGTGKTTIANYIHSLSNRKSSPFVHCNLSSISVEKMEQELFGFECSNQKIVQKGKLELAKSGTLYIEDIGNLPLDIQAIFMNALQNKMFNRVNGNDSIPLNTRLMVSVKGNLFEEMNAGNFLESLYYLLMGLPIKMPSLRERGSDILVLANRFITEFSQRNKVEKKELTNKAKKQILRYSFPGNIIELKSTIDRAMVLSENNQITEDDIEFMNTSNQLHFLDSDMTFEEYKSKIIHHYLEQYDGDIMQVSNKLDIGKSTIYRMLKSEKEKGSKRLSWFNMF